MLIGASLVGCEKVEVNRTQNQLPDSIARSKMRRESSSLE